MYSLSDGSMESDGTPLMVASSDRPTDIISLSPLYISSGSASGLEYAGALCTFRTIFTGFDSMARSRKSKDGNGLTMTHP